MVLGEKTALGGVVHNAMEGIRAAMAAGLVAGAFGIEMILSRNAGHNLALLRYAKALHIGFVGFHTKTAGKRSGQYARNGLKKQLLLPLLVLDVFSLGIVL